VAVAIVVIPQSLAYAEIAGLPPARGLLAAALPPLAAALVASSPHLQTGPVAMTSLLTFGALSAIAEPGTAEYVGLAALLALVVGAVRLLIGIAHAGVVSHFLSHPVLSGFTSAAALLIIASQIPTLLGADAPDGRLLARAAWSLAHPAAWEPFSAILGVAVAVLVFGGRRIHPLLPAVPIAVAAGLAAAAVAGDGHPIVGDLPGGFPQLSLAVPWSRLPELLVPGAVIALVGFAEAAAISVVFSTQDRMSWNADREFAGQGLANLAAGISGAFPVGGSFSRSMINRVSGSRTRWSGAITGAAVLAFLPFAGVLEPLPRAVLGGIVVGAVLPLLRPQDLVWIYRHSRAQGLVGIGTFALTLALSPRIDQAVLLGIGLGVAVHLMRELKVSITTSIDGDTLRVHPGGVLYFASAHRIRETLLEHIATNPQADRLIIDLEGVGRLDYTGAAILRGLADQAQDAGLTVELTGVTPTLRRIVDSVWHDNPPPANSITAILRRFQRFGRSRN
jgi:SulP family sulfate permease